MIYIVSDTHFFHNSIMKFCPSTRRGVNAEEMTWNLVDAFNNKVGEHDELILLGDLSFKNAERTLEVLRAIKCKNKRLILGNHDQVLDHKTVRDEFISVEHYRVVRWEGWRFICFHYPMREWEGMHKGYFHLFGHVHGNLNHVPYGRSMDVGIDARPDNKMEPWSIEEIFKMLEDRPILPHHGRVITEEPAKS